MNTRIFRQVSLERLASPEQLDQLLRVTNPKRWAGLLGVFLLLATIVVWGFEGSIATTASGQGVIVRSGGVMNVVSRGSGLVLSVSVKPGDKIQANQVIARISQPALVEKMAAMNGALAENQRERGRALQVRKDGAKLQLAALDRERANDQRQIGELQEQSKLAKEDIVVEDQLLAKGLVTKQQTINARQKRISIEGQIAALRARATQLDAQAFAAQAIPLQEDADMQSRISAMARELATVKKGLEMAESVVSTYGGQVLELKVDAGGTVAEGQPILSIQPDVQHLELLAYLPSLQAKDLKKGMEVQISPSTIKREEFGFMKGKILYVSDYPATAAAMMRDFQNEALVASLTLSGPVTEILVELEMDPRSPSGFRWSTSQGPPVVISGGTICTVEMVTRRQKPVTLVLPYTKQKLGL
jgi:HlyD family secretion protein